MNIEIHLILLDAAEGIVPGAGASAFALSLVTHGPGWVQNDEIPNDVKHEFLANVLNLLEKHEKYEYCSIIQKYKLELEKKIEHEQD